LKIFQIFSYIAETVSVVCLAATFIILIKLRRVLKNDRVVLQINLTLALMLLHFCCLFQEVAVTNHRSCELLTILIHYFLLTSGKICSKMAVHSD